MMKLLLIVFLCGIAAADNKKEIQFRRHFVHPRYHQNSVLPQDTLRNSENSNFLPYQVLINFQDETNDEWLCSGSLISENFVLTTGHCAYKAKTAIVSVGVRDASKNNHQNGIPSEKIIIHNDYVSSNTMDNIALIKLSKHVQFNDNVKAVSLTEDTNIEGSAVVGGWEQTNGYSHRSLSPLHLFSTTILDNDTCGESYKRICEKHLCGSAPNDGSSCVGDPGSPLVVEKESEIVQIGILSHNAAYCMEGKPTVYTRTSNYFNWIKENAEL